MVFPEEDYEENEIGFDGQKLDAYCARFCSRCKLLRWEESLYLKYIGAVEFVDLV